MVNPFEDDNGTFHVLINAEGQYSLWPAFAAVPNGWTQVLADATRAECLEYVERNWTDMRPRSVVEQAATAGREDS